MNQHPPEGHDHLEPNGTHSPGDLLQFENGGVVVLLHEAEHHHGHRAWQCLVVKGYTKGSTLYMTPERLAVGIQCEPVPV